MSIPVNTNLAGYYYAQGEFARSRPHLERMSQLDQERTVEYQVRIAESYANEGRLANAVQEFRSILAKAPDNTRAMRGLAITRQFLGDEFTAKDWYTRAESINPLDISRLRLLEAQEDYEASLLLLEDLLQRVGNRRNPFVLAQLFRASYLSGDIAKATEYHRERLGYVNGRIEVEPNNSEQFDALLVAEYLIRHGEANGFDPGRGQEMLDEALAGLLALRAQGYAHPETLASLAVANAMKGNAIEALENLNEAVDRGGRDPVYVGHYAAIAELAGSQDMQAIAERVEAAVTDEVERLAGLTLEPYVELVERQPIALGREVLAGYAGFYTDSNILAHVRLDESGNLVISAGQRQPPVQLFPFAEDRFFTAIDKSATIDVGRDENGEITHLLFKVSGGVQRLKVAPAPPPAIELDRDILERYEGTYAWARPSADPTTESDANYWVGVISIDEDGVLWLDLDDQPALVLTPYAETEFFMPGFVGHFVFDVSANPRQASQVVYYKDGMVFEFVRQ